MNPVIVSSRSAGVRLRKLSFIKRSWAAKSTKKIYHFRFAPIILTTLFYAELFFCHGALILAHCYRPQMRFSVVVRPEIDTSLCYTNQRPRLSSTTNMESSSCEMETTAESLKNAKLSRLKHCCYMHVASVKHEEVNVFTNTRWNTYKASLQRWQRHSFDQPIGLQHRRNFNKDVTIWVRHANCSLWFHPTCRLHYMQERG